MNKLSSILISFPPNEEAFAAIKARLPNCEVRVAPMLTHPSQTLPRSLLQGVDATLMELPPANFEDFDRLKFIQLSSTGFEQLENLPLVERGIRVSNSRGVFDVPIAEWNILMILLWHRRLPEMMENQRHSIWDPSPKFQDELRGATVGFYGYGGIARETTRLAKAMGLNVWALTVDGTAKPRPEIFCLPGVGDPGAVLPDRFFPFTDRQAFLAGLDYLVITMPLTPSTRGLVGENELRSLKPTAVLINPARAPIVEEQALLRCLRERWIRGASFDVHYAYPLPADHPLWNTPEIILTPHISGSSGTRTFPKRLYDIFVQNLGRLQDSQPLLNEISPQYLRGA